MVRNSEIPEVGTFSQVVARVVKARLDDAGISGSELGRRLDRAQSYASLRLNGRKAWTLDELDRISSMLGETVDGLIAEARKSR